MFYIFFSGLPHVHFCLCLDWERMRNLPGGIIRTPEEYLEQYICAEIPEEPDPNDKSEAAQLQQALYETIITKNVHTCLIGRCLIEGKCMRKFPVIFIKRT